MKRLFLLVLLAGCSEPEAKVEPPLVKVASLVEEVEPVQAVPQVEEPQAAQQPQAFLAPSGACDTCASIGLVPPKQGDPYTTPPKVAPYVSSFVVTIPAGEFSAGECTTCPAVNGRSLRLTRDQGRGCDRHWSYQAADCTIEASAYFSESGGQCVMNAVITFSGVGRGGSSAFLYRSAPGAAGSFAPGTPIPCGYVSTQNTGGRIKCRTAGTAVAVTLR